MNDSEMRDDYDFSKSVRNPYARKLKRPITIRLEPDTIDYFKNLSSTTGIPYQSLMNMFLSDCARNHKQPQVSWK
jgi:predicted DNA binding CopG/RHH family protein